MRITSAPPSASATATACPIPLVPPVTNAVCPSSENILNPAGTAMFPSFSFASCYLQWSVSLEIKSSQVKSFNISKRSTAMLWTTTTMTYQNSSADNPAKYRLLKLTLNPPPVFGILPNGVLCPIHFLVHGSRSTPISTLLTFTQP